MNKLKPPVGAMVYIEAGTFTMGAPDGEGYNECLKYRKDCKKSWFLNETPKVIYVPGFYIDVYEVTQGDFLKVMGFNPSHSQGEGVAWNFLPVDSETLKEAKDYCEKIGKRLPEEKEWEKAAHGGTSTTYYWGDELKPYANFCDVKCRLPNRLTIIDDGFADSAPVGSYPPNEYGLYDMAGNVWEWISNDYSDSFTDIDPNGPNPWRSRGLRGAGWPNSIIGLRPSFRDWFDPDTRGVSYGFRCAKDRLPKLDVFR